MSEALAVVEDQELLDPVDKACATALKAILSAVEYAAGQGFFATHFPGGKKRFLFEEATSAASALMGIGFSVKVKKWDWFKFWKENGTYKIVVSW